MQEQNSPNLTSRSPKKRDVPHLIKWILLIILLILLFLELFSGEYKRLFDQGGGIVWLVVLIKVLLIIGIIILIVVQRSLKCAIVSPTGCTEETPDPVKGILFITVKGTAAGGAFGYYTIEIQKDGDPPYPANIISYPGGGSNGTIPVLSGDLATIDTTALSDSAYTITLRLYPSGGGAPHVCTKTFNLLKVAVWINSVDGIAPTPNIFDEEGKLMSGGIEQSFGGSLTILGSAYIYECNNRKVERVEMLRAAIPFGGPVPMQPANNTPIPASWAGNPVGSPLIYDPTKYYFWTRIGAAPTNLLNTWGTCTIGMNTYPSLAPEAWNSRTATNAGDYFKLLLATKDTGGFVYYDTQKIWIDNYSVIAKIVKFQRQINGVWTDLPNCTDVMLSWGKLRIIGIAWDALINSLYPVTRPNDNFNNYGLKYAKQFVPNPVNISISPTVDKPFLASNARVPHPSVFPLTGPIPIAPGDADLLVEWDLSTLDAGATALTDCPNPVADPHKLFRGCECTYIIRLDVSDFTIGSEYSVHNTSDFESVKIINDL